MICPKQLTYRKVIHIMTINTNQILDVMREAGKIMLRAHDMEDNENFQVKPGTTNFVTVYDVAVQTFLIEHFSQLFPDAVYFAEEKENEKEQQIELLNEPEETPLGCYLTILFIGLFILGFIIFASQSF